jgi:hypothetical protein
VPVVDGALQPAGTASVTEPLARPPVAAVNVKTIVLPVEALLTEPVGVVSVPEPSAARIVIDGDDPRFARVPADVDFSCACQVWAPVVDGAVAPGPPPAVEPYVNVNVEPPASVTFETVIVWPATETVPELAVV